MRVSIWQQFSSNHSAWFTVVGIFKTPDEAQKAGAEAMAMLQSVQDWWDALPEDELNGWLENRDGKQLTPVEQSLAQQYQIEWPFRVEWHDPDGISKEEPPIEVVENMVFIDPPHSYVSQVPQPFDSLLRKLGGEVVVGALDSSTHEDTHVTADIVLQAPDEQSAEAIFEEIEASLDGMSGPPPWIGYFQSAYYKLDVTPRERFKMAQIYMARDFARWHLDADDFPSHEAYQKQQDEILAENPELPYDADTWVGYALNDAGITLEQLETLEGLEVELAASREGREIRITNLPPAEDGFAPLIGAITRWLDDIGGTLVEATFTERAYPEGYW